MNRIHISDESNCARANECFPLTAKRQAKQKWIDTHDLFSDSTGRMYALVDTTKRVFFMDCITGSLYNFGECLSSEDLKIMSMTRADDAHKLQLLFMQADYED